MIAIFINLILRLQFCSALLAIFKKLLDCAFQPLKTFELKILHDSAAGFRKAFFQVFNQRRFYVLGKNGDNWSISGSLKMADAVIILAHSAAFNKLRTFIQKLLAKVFPSAPISAILLPASPLMTEDACYKRGSAYIGLYRPI